ncbi:hypothetical protein [Streptomyces sp. NPDC026589]|uniref:hypothetical protein n=1 Tax=Streptomyces TaxID=1883 RepID=UPI0033F9B450|nr:hypothetical protein OHB50_31065 [Streptomyces anulatus]
MSEDMTDGLDDIVSVLTDRIETRFGMRLDLLRKAVAARPTAYPAATEAVTWHGRLVESQADLDRAEDALLAVLDTQSREIDDPALALAFQVDAAVQIRDGRAMVLRLLLDPDAPQKQGLAAQRLARLTRGDRTGPAVSASAPPHSTTSVPSVPVAGRSVRR